MYDRESSYTVGDERRRWSNLLIFTQIVIRLYRTLLRLASMLQAHLSTDARRRNASLKLELCYAEAMQKLYCFVDEAGQHTEGCLFVVCVVVIDGTAKREEVTQLLETIEQVSRKRKQKWRTSRHEERFAYMTAVLTNSAFKGLLFYQMHFSSREYMQMTVQTTASALQMAAQPDYKATVLVDGLIDSVKHAFSNALRQRSVRIRKVHGVDDRKEALIRLADALCGLIVDAYEGNVAYSDLMKQGQKDGFIREIR